MPTMSDSARPSVVEFVAQHLYAVAITVVVLSCIFTRIRSGRQHQPKQTGDRSEPRRVPRIPYWLPWIGHLPNYMTGFQEYLMKVSEQNRGGIFALHVAGSTHNVVTSSSLMKELHTRRNLPLKIEGFVYHFITTFMGDRGDLGKLASSPKGHAAIWSEAHKEVSTMMREPFLGNATSQTAKAAGEQVWQLVSGNASRVDQFAWERAAAVQIMPNREDKTFAAESNVNILIRNWVSSVTTPFVLGRAFMENNPQFVEDFWCWSDKMELFVIGLPPWLVPGLTPACADRERLIKAVTELHQALLDVMDGKDPGSRYDDLSDVPQLIWERTKMLRRAGASLHCIAVSNMTVAWAMNANANHVIWWMIFYLYSNPALLALIRKEIEPYVKIQKVDIASAALDTPPKLEIDVQGLVFKTPLFKGAMYETMRFEIANAPFKVATDDFTITESAQDAELAGKPYPETYLIKKGEFVCSPGRPSQLSDDYFPKPENFDAKRFWVKNKDAEKVTDDIDTTNIKLDYGIMKPWGGGEFICKGRTFAEREVMIFVASVIMCWEMEPVGDGKWKHPGSKMVSGTNAPKKDVRVKMWRRTVS